VACSAGGLLEENGVQACLLHPVTSVSWFLCVLLMESVYPSHIRGSRTELNGFCSVRYPLLSSLDSVMVVLGVF
jgi:hypothetical protein